MKTKSDPQSAAKLFGKEQEASAAERLNRNQRLLLILAIIMVALNLRPALSSISPILAEIRLHNGLNSSMAGILTTLPVACLGLFAPFAPILSRRLTAERMLVPLLLLLATGIALRGTLGNVGLFGGSFLAGLCIGMIGVLLPGIIKREFPHQATLMMGVYTMALCLGAALAAGFAVPVLIMFNSLDIALGFWALPAILAALLWWPFRQQGSLQDSQPHHNTRVLWRDPLAWQVTLFMGLQSSLAYGVFGWLPSILQERGASPAESGIYLSASVMVQVFSALAVPWLSSFFRDQKLIITLMWLLIYAGLMGSVYAPIEGFWVWMIILGLGQGGGFAMALALIVLRSPNSAVAAQLSGMSQGVGYTMASLGPYFMGVMHEMSGSWHTIGWLLSAIALAGIYFGIQAGANRLVLEKKPDAG
ncbi:CynX/NimT family MFS transporter [Methylobacillus caricis]|uniref:CynX/NimT family MFS transporter n=1 Tax=Methylobacillus caricis TaxID=1971611 RepID=UPI001CFF8C4C|nr:CynX/NimT family MFS transporter [Methylobacillus caricis]MCB5187613.1 CynX/NimT family MFS transporter [Methylobacillus caricis]